VGRHILFSHFEAGEVLTGAAGVKHVPVVGQRQTDPVYDVHHLVHIHLLEHAHLPVFEQEQGVLNLFHLLVGRSRSREAEQCQLHLVLPERVDVFAVGVHRLLVGRELLLSLFDVHPPLSHFFFHFVH